MAEQQSRHKLDPRLAMLLDMSRDSRNELLQRETEHLRQVCGQLGRDAKQLAEVQTQRAAPEASADLERAIRSTHTRLFAPVTTGVREPRLNADAPDSGETEFSAFILADASPEHLEKLGARIRTQAGDIFTAFIPESAIAALQVSPAVRYIELARSVFPTLVASPAIQAEAQPPAAYRRPAGGPQGKGTIIGIVDTCLDIFHADFRQGMANSTRILYLWDQTLVPQGRESNPSGWLYKQAYSYGVEYTADDINDQISRFPSTPPYQVVRHNGPGDPQGHGTMVTGIAAGNGRSPGQHLGGAPAADIVFVALPNPLTADALADTAQVMDAFSYIFARAESVGKPCVINMSQGDNLGPHDGASIGERFLDALLEKPGRAITLSAGNSTTTACHATDHVAQDADLTVDIDVDPGQTRSDAIDVWYSGEDELSAELAVPGLNGAVGPVAPGSAPAIATANGGTQIDMSCVKHPINGENHVSIQLIVAPGGTLPAGRWRLRLHGTKIAKGGAFHAWIDRNNREEVASGEITSHLRFALPDETGLTLGSPGTAQRPITVGNHGIDVPPTIFETSGLGPTRDDRVKPEIAACGVRVPAPLAWDRRKGLPRNLYARFTGTSVSAPFVAGACACLFESRGAALTWAHIKQMLKDTAGTDGFQPPHPGFGYGYLRFNELFATSTPRVDVWLKHAVEDIGQEPRSVAIEWLSPDIELLDMNRRAASNPSRAKDDKARNIVRVRVRNRGTSVARDTDVRLFWQEAATQLPIPSGWKGGSRIYVEGPGGFAESSNTRRIAAIGPGEFAQVEFGFAAPAGGQDVPIAFLAQVSNRDDPLNEREGEVLLPGLRNNVAMRCVHVSEFDAGTVARVAFCIAAVGRDEADSIMVMPDLAKGEISLTLPAAALPSFIRERVRNADVTINEGLARLRLDGGDLYIPRIRVAAGQPIEAALEVRAPLVDGIHRFVHVAHRAAGQLVGGVSLELRPR